jgi:hypothetical protein
MILKADKPCSPPPQLSAQILPDPNVFGFYAILQAAGKPGGEVGGLDTSDDALMAKDEVQ